MVQRGAWQDAYRQKLNGPGVPAPATQRFMQDARERPHEYTKRMVWLWSAQSITTILENGIEQIKLGPYTNLKKVLLSEADYVSLKSGYAKQANTLAEQISSHREERQTLDSQEILQNEWIERFRKYREIETLDRLLVTDLIEQIDVHEGRRITIHFKFQDEFEKGQALVEQEICELKSTG